MTQVFRILRRPYSRQPFGGEGAYRFGGRWSSPGVRLAYAAEHFSLAIIEYFVHIDIDDPPTDLVLVSARVPSSVSRVSIPVRRLPRNWRQTPSPPELASIGDNFVESARSAVLIVPSVLAPSESNWLINPAHPDFRKIRINPTEPFRYDHRFFSE